MTFHKKQRNLIVLYVSHNPGNLFTETTSMFKYSD